MNKIEIKTRRSMGYLDTTITIGNYSESELLREDELDEQMENIINEAFAATSSKKVDLEIMRSLINGMDFTIEDYFPETER